MTQTNGSTSYPSQVVLEVTNRCNFRCRYCHFHGQGVPRKRPLGMMKTTVWEKVLDEISDWPDPVDLVTHGAGEPLLYPELDRLLARAKQIPNVTLGFMTNGMLLNGNWISKIIDIGLDAITFSIDGVDPKTHDFYRVNADLETIERNVAHLIEEKDRRSSQLPRINFNMVGYPDILHQTDAYLRKWLPSALSISVSTFRSIGSRRLWETQPFPFRPCPLLYHQQVISFDGVAGLCCEDIHSAVPLGNIEERALVDLFNRSETLVKYRQFHENGKVNGLPLCGDCHIWAADILADTTTFHLGDMVVERRRYPAFDLYTRNS